MGGEIMTDIKKCPFCGSESDRKLINKYRKIKGRGQSYLAIVGCTRCTAQVQAAAFDIETAWGYAENLWNKRTNEAMND
jgi:hypothetical protein